MTSDLEIKRVDIKSGESAVKVITLVLVRY